MIEFEIREEDIDGFKEWTWIKGDSGAWDGPKSDWRTYHKQKILQYCKNFRVAVQAGGCMGMYPRLLSQIFDVVYTFEPAPHNFYCLVHNILDRRVVAFNAAVGPAPGLISLQGGINSNRGTAKVEEKSNSFIPRVTIDQIQYRDCDLLMLDVEGYEEEALKGAMGTIEKFNPVIFAERGESRCKPFLKAIGYNAVDSAAQDTIFVRDRKV